MSATPSGQIDHRQGRSAIITGEESCRGCGERPTPESPPPERWGRRRVPIVTAPAGGPHERLPPGHLPPGHLPSGVWRLTIAAGLAFYLDAATLMSVAIALPIWRDHHQLLPWQVGLISGGLAFAVAAGALIGGWLGDRFGRGRVFTYDLAVFVVGTVVIITAPNVAALAAGVIIVGLAAGADVPTALAVIADAAPDHARGRLTGVTQVMWIAAILATYALGFTVSTLGFVGTQILIGHLVLLAVLTLGLRLILTAPPQQRGLLASHSRLTVTPRALVSAGAAVPLVLTGLFFACWNIASTLLGSYGPYFLVTVTGLTQTQATGLVLVTFPPALLMSLLFVRLADTVWRDRMFVVALVLQIAAFSSGAATGGTVVAGMVALIVLFSLSNVFAGEAIYKVWSQLLIPSSVRSTAIGVTYASARGLAATLLLFVPALIDRAPSAMLWLQVGAVTASGLIGLVIIRHRSFQPLLRPVHPPVRVTISGTGAPARADRPAPPPLD